MDADMQTGTDRQICRRVQTGRYAGGYRQADMQAVDIQACRWQVVDGPCRDGFHMIYSLSLVGEGGGEGESKHFPFFTNYAYSNFHSSLLPVNRRNFF
jgi:hypothetical protein